MTTNNRKQFHERLWSAAVQLRANSGLKLNQISEPILGLIFLKFADVRFKRAKDEIENKRNKNKNGRQAPLTPDHFKSKGILYLPEKATFSYLINLPGSENIGKAVNEAMKQIEENNTDLAGVLPQDYTSLHKVPGENSQILITLLKNFNQIPDDIEGDAFGEIYEYFLGEFARSEGAKGGEFFTPQSIVKLLVEIIEPYHGRILDPACGSGGMFVQSANFVKSHSAKKSQVMNEVALYGQEKISNNIRIAKMNLAIHGLSGKIAEVNSFYTDAFNSVGAFDFVLANPPFNVKGKDKNKQIVIDPEKIKDDPRYYLGLPITGKGEISNGNYLWIQMFARALSPKGRTGFVMANSATDAGNAEKEIRKKLIESGIVDVIISTPPNMFLNVTLSSTLWFLDKGKQGTDRENKILFINAQDIFTPIDRAHNEWTPDQIQEIAGIVRRYRGEEGFEKYEDIKGRAKSISLDVIKENGYSLNPGRYVEIVEKEIDNVEFEARMKELSTEFKTLTQQAHELEKKIEENWKKTL
jgi:type I restriction enzyme M protein